MSNMIPDDPEQTRAVPSLVEGTEIGQYVIKRTIASGGMGTVYEALQKNPRRPVAIKVIKAALANPHMIRRLEYEAQVLARLSHPGIARIYEAGTYDVGGQSIPFFAMEYIPNAKSIREYAADKKLSIRDRLALFLQVCDAVHHGHQRGIVHRDLKPSNILVDSNGRTRVIDFGVAKATDTDMKQAAVQTGYGQIVGSVQYMSPEQFDADPHDIDTRSDVYALGLILYELLSGTLPYATDSGKIFDFASEVRQGNMAPIGSKDKSLRGDIEAIVCKALQKDRENRYQSAFGLAQDIRRYLSGEAVIARRSGFFYQFRVMARRNKTVTGLVAGVFVLLIAGIIATTSLLIEVNQERQKAEIATEKATAGEEFLSRILTSAFPPGWGDQITVLGVLDRASQMLTGAFPEDPEIEAGLRTSLGQAYMNLGHWESSLRELKTALGLSESILGETHEKTLAIRYELRVLYGLIGATSADLDNARAIEAALTKLYGPSDFSALDARGDVASSLEDNGHLKEARLLSKEVFDDLREHLGADSAQTLNEEVRYAWLLLKSGQIDNARETAHDALDRVLKQVSSENHTMVRRAKSCLAAVYIVNNEIDSAIILYGNFKAPEKFGIEHTFQGKFDLESKPFQLLVFFETWCPYSHQAMVRLEEVNRQYGQFGLNVLGLTSITRSSSETEVEQYLKENHINFAAFKENGRSWNYYNCDGTPSIRLLCKGYLIWEYAYPAIDRIPTQMLEAMVSAQSCGIIQ